MISSQNLRRIAERVAVANLAMASEALREEVEAEARKRKLSTLKQNADDRERNLRERETGKTSVVVAKRVGMSERTYDKARKVVEAARRHLTESQRAAVAAKIANMREGRQEANGSIDTFVSQDQAATMLNVGVASVKRARAVIDKGAPELVAMLSPNWRLQDHALPAVEAPAARSL